MSSDLVGSPEIMQELKDIANKLRIHSINATSASNSGHPTSCASMAEIISVLFFNTMKYSTKYPRLAANDRFILSKGHAAPILYAAWAEAGVVPVSELTNLRKIDNDLEGHPTPRLNFIDVATGSLGQGLGVAAGMAYVGKYIDKSDYRTYCLIGDGESAEGSIWEALAFGGNYKLDNLVAIFDLNRLGQSEATAYQHKMDLYKARLESFGWNTYVVDGHSVEDLVQAFNSAKSVKYMPTCILAKTLKGKGFPDIEDKDNWHGKPLGAKADSVIDHLKSLIANHEAHGISVKQPESIVPSVDLSNIKLADPPHRALGEKVATRLSYGEALVKLGKNNSRVIALDGDTKNSTFSLKYKDAFPDRFIECYIAEQNLVSVAIGVACRDRAVVFVSTFAAFLSRAYDQIRMGAISQTNVNFCGSHCGVSIGEDGPSQMALEDLAMFRAIPSATVFYPSDATSTERAVELAANTKGICFIRTSRPNVHVIYGSSESFEIGKGKIVRQSDNDHILLIGSCVTLHEALKAADLLEKSGIHARVLDPFTIKPIDKDLIIESAKQCGGKIITIEDHYPEGGIGDAVLSAVAEEPNIVVRKLAVNGIPRSGKCDELLAMFKIDSAAIVETAKSML